MLALVLAFVNSSASRYGFITLCEYCLPEKSNTGLTEFDSYGQTDTFVTRILGLILLRDLASRLMHEGVALSILLQKVRYAFYIFHSWEMQCRFL